MALPIESNLQFSSEELLEAQALLWNNIYTFINSMSLKCAIELCIPDIIHKHGKPMTFSELIEALPINKTKSHGIYRLMRILINSKIFVSVNENEKDEAYWLTPASRLLLRDEPLSVATLTLLVLDPVSMDPWHHVAGWFKNDDTTSTVTKHGMSFYELCGHEPRINQLINIAMANDSYLVSRVITGDCKQVFNGLELIVDVGGGTGTLAKAIVDAFPTTKCKVFDLPHVVEGLEDIGNLIFVGGNMFESIPQADAVLLKWILHNWNDEKCVQILEKCKEAIANTNVGDKRGQKVIIIDIVIEDGKNLDSMAKGTQLLLDMQMVALFDGKQRNEKEWRKLFFDAGFSDYKITPALGLRSLIEVYP